MLSPSKNGAASASVDTLPHSADVTRSTALTDEVSQFLQRWISDAEQWLSVLDEIGEQDTDGGWFDVAGASIRRRIRGTLG